MKKIQILVSLVLCMNGRIQAQESNVTFIIQNNSEAITEITFFKYNFEKSKMEELQILTNVSSGKKYIVRNHMTEPSIYLIKSNNGTEAKVAVEESGQVNVLLGDQVMIESAVAQKSDFSQTIQQLNGQFFGELIAEFDKAMKINDQTKLAKLEKKKDEILIQFQSAMENAVRKMGASALAYDALPFFDMHKNRQFIEEMIRQFQTKYPNTGMSKALQDRIDKANTVSIGSRAPSFKAKDIGGVFISPSDFAGKYLLIDFWASWCRACRVENPKLVEVYKNFKTKGFDIVSVSIDANDSNWKKALNEDKLSWRQVLDRDKSIYSVYLLSSLPSNFLLDDKGRIIARNIHANELEKLLEQRE